MLEGRGGHAHRAVRPGPARPAGLRINAADPGFTATDLNGGTGHQSVQEGTDAIVRLATIGPDGPTGTLLSRTGPVPW